MTLYENLIHFICDHPAWSIILTTVVCLLFMTAGYLAHIATDKFYSLIQDIRSKLDARRPSS